jgi:hypothetical protein
LSTAPGRFNVDWMRALDGVTSPGVVVQGGAIIEPTAPWQGEDVVLRLQREATP